MAVATKGFDVSALLTSGERIAAYLEEAFESGEPSVIVAALGAVARARNNRNLHIQQIDDLSS